MRRLAGHFLGTLAVLGFWALLAYCITGGFQQ